MCIVYYLEDEEVINNIDDLEDKIIKYYFLNNFHDDNYQIIVNKYGKKYFKNKSIFFNISHSKNVLIIGFSSSEIGVDIEYINPNRVKRFLNKDYLFFSELEKNKILKSNNQSIQFYRLWTSKESYLKYLGRGISKQSYLINIDLNNLNNPMYSISNYIMGEFIISICLKDKQDIVFKKIDIKELNNQTK